jgi:hypothetical protein
MNIEHTTSPSSTDIDFLTQKINEETPDFGAAHPFAFFIPSSQQAVDIRKLQMNQETIRETNR